MDRKEFIKTCGLSCVGIIGISLVPSCKPARQVQTTISNNQLTISKKEFEIQKGERISYHKSILTRPAGIDYPLVVYRFSDSDYSALLLRCTHQNNELNLNGDIMTCPAHGSEFGNRGEVVQGPAEQNLQAFKVTSDQNAIYIQLI